MKTMLKVLSVLVILAAVAMMATGCQKAAPANAQLPNPMKAVTFDEMVEKAGIPLYAPNGAENVQYYTITAGDRVIAELDFTLNGKVYTQRASYNDMDVTSLSGIYFTKSTESFAKVSYCEGKIVTEGKTSVLFWEDRVPGACYSLSCTDCENPAVLLEIAESVFAPLQGDSGPIQETEA